jgi:Fic family protein
LIALLVEYWGLLHSPLLYVSVPFKRHRQAYYQHLMDVRVKGDWEGWIAFFLRCVHEAGEDGVNTASRLIGLLEADRRRVLDHRSVTLPAVRLFDLLPKHPMVGLANTIGMLKTTKPTAAKAIDVLRKAGVLQEITGKQRDRVYVYRAYLDVLAEDTRLQQE